MDTVTLFLAALLVLAGLAMGLGLGLVIARARHRRTAPSAEVTAILAPAADAMARIETQLREVERDRIGAYAALREQVASLHRASAELGRQTSTLAGALAAPPVRGRWGEVQLQRIVELAGMVEHCDFDTQVSIPVDDGRQRPDLVVRLAGGRSIPVDAKAPMAAWLRANERSVPHGGETAEAAAATSRLPGESAHGYDDAPRVRELLRQHARAVRGHVDALAAKSYWRLFDPAPEFVVMFVPGEAFLDAALSADPGLTEYAFERQVVIATPGTLIALLRTVAFTWRQERLTQSAEQIRELGRELHHRLATFAGHLAKVGTGLDRAVGSYNAAVRSLESRVLVSARRFADLGVTGECLPEPEQIHTAASVPTAPPNVSTADNTRRDTDEAPAESAASRLRDPVP